MFRPLFVLFAACCITATLAAPASAADRLPSEDPPGIGTSAPPETEKELSALPGPTLQVYFENDLFYNSDRYYTNAVQVRLVSRDLRVLAENGLLPEGLSNLLGEVPFPGSADAARYNLSLGIGQQIYTPADTQARNPDPDDHPYAGYLYGFLALHAKKRNRLDTLELAAGVIGPSALGEQAQNEVHRIRGIDTAKGWDYQLHDEPALMLTWTRAWRLNERPGGWGWDALPHIGASAGTPFTQAFVGGELRLGWNLPPDYGSSTIRPGSGIYAPSDPGRTNARQSGIWDEISLYLFTGAEGRAVAHNTFLDGNTWQDSRSVDKFPLVGDLSWGVAVSAYGFRFTYTHVYRSSEFHTQGCDQNFGSITLGYTF